jgi:trigger factor
VKVSAQEIEQRQMVLEIEVEEERVQRALDQAYKRIVNRINVPGFRRGRAPRPLVERMVGREALLEDAVEHLVPQAFQDALNDRQITPGGQPSYQVTSTEPLQFKATVPLQPSVELGDYRSIEIPLEPVVVDESEVQAVIENLRESNATWVPVERAAQVGDRVGLDVKATRGEKTLLDNQDVEFVINPEGPEPAPGFSEQLAGLEAEQERRFSLPLGEGSEGEAAQPAEFVVKLHWVKEKQLPELDDEFARSVAEKGTVDQLREGIREQIQQHKDQQARQRQREATIQAAVDQARVDVPPQAVERQANQLLQNMAVGLDKQGISIEQYLQLTGKDESTFRSELMAEADRSLKRSLVLSAIAEAEHLEVSEDEVRQEVELASRGANDPARTAREALRRSETRARIESVLLASKAVERLVEIAGGRQAEPAREAGPEPTEGPNTSGETNV